MSMEKGQASGWCASVCTHWDHNKKTAGLAQSGGSYLFSVLFQHVNLPLGAHVLEYLRPDRNTDLAQVSLAQ